MSLWLVFLFGIIAGVLTGIISGRSTYANCRELLKELEQEVHDKENNLPTQATLVTGSSVNTKTRMATSPGSNSTLATMNSSAGEEISRCSRK